MGLFGGKKKEKGKGFEVVRSVRGRPELQPFDEEETSPPAGHEPYHDSPTEPGPARKRESVGLVDLSHRTTVASRNRGSMSDGSYDDLSDNDDPFGLEGKAIL